MAISNGSITVTLIGDEALKAKLHGSRADAPVGRFLDRAAIHLQGGARKNAPVDTGRLRNSIGTKKPSIRSREVGPSVNYGKHVEFGTRPHFPPTSALQGWAAKRGISAFQVARAISRRGTKAQSFMQPAADETEGYVVTIVPILAAEIESAFQ